MKILHFLVTDRLSGAENVHLGILEAFKDTDEVVYVSPDGPIRRAVEERGVRFIPCDTDNIKEVRRIYNEERPDVVHACDPRMSFNCARAGIPFISHLHNNCPWMKKYSPNSFALRFAIGRASAVIAVSPSVSDDYVFRKAFKDKLYVIPNVVDREKVESMAQEPFDGEYDLLFVGRMTDQKRPHLFLDFVKGLTERLPGVRAAMLGEGELFDEVKDRISGERISNVELLGFDPNPYRIMKRSKISIMTSYYEGFGLVAVEGMILGKPVLAYPSGGISEIAQAGGVLCRTNEEMTDAAYRLLTDERFYTERSAAARDASFRYTDKKSYIAAVREVYAEAANTDLQEK